MDHREEDDSNDEYRGQDDMVDQGSRFLTHSQLIFVSLLFELHMCAVECECQ